MSAPIDCPVNVDELLDVEQYVTFFNDAEHNQSSKAQLIGISLQGARVLFDNPTTEIGHRASITVSFIIDNNRNTMLLSGKVVDLVNDQDSGAQSVVMQFAGLDKSDTNLLHLFVYQLMLIEKGAI